MDAPRRSSDWMLFLLLIIMGGIFVLMSMVPIWMKRRTMPLIPSDEICAEAALKQLASVEEVWKREDTDDDGVHDYWTRDLAAFYFRTREKAYAGIPYIDKSLANADKDGLSRYSNTPPVPWRGYWFRATPLDAGGNSYCTEGKDENRTAYAFCAWPERYNTTGVRTFIVNDGGVIYAKDTGGQPIDRWPADLEKEGWVEAN